MPSAKPKQLLTFPLLWSIVLFLLPVPALGDIDSNCTVGDSSDGDALSLVPTCSANTAKLDVVFNETGDDSIDVRIDYVCIGNGNEMIVGTPWPGYHVLSPSPTTRTPSVNVTELQAEMNCTFYVCYRRFTSSYSLVKGKATPASCITDINECETANGGCEQTCSNTIGSFACSCDVVGYQLNENGLNCTDIDECESDGLNNCHENAECIDTEGSFNCSCNPGYKGDGVNCTNIDECELGIHTCDSNANCTDTVGSFSCTCIDDFEGDGFNCTALSSPGVGILPVVLVPTILFVMIIALLCGVICVVYQHTKKLKFQIMFHKNEKIDLDFYPVSPLSVPKPTPSLVSVFDKLCTIPDSKPHFQDSDTDSDGQSEILETDPATKLMDNLVDNNSIGMDVGTPENDDNCIANPPGQGYDASEAHQNMAGVSLEPFVETESHVFPVFEESENCVLDLEEDAQNDDVLNFKMEATIASKVVEKSSNYVHSDNLLEDSGKSVSALNSNENTLESDLSTNEQGCVDSEGCQKSEEPVSLMHDFDEDGQSTKQSSRLGSSASINCPAINQKDKGASNFAEESSNCSHSEDLLEVSHEFITGFDLNDHIPESDFPSLDNCVMSFNEQGYGDSEACQTIASVSLDIPAANCPSIDQNNIIASNFVEQISNNVCSEDLLEGGCGLIPALDHSPESDIPSLDNSIMTTNERRYVDSEACQTTASVSPKLSIERVCEEGNFPASEDIVSLVLDIDEDRQNNNSEQEPTFGDIPASSHSSEPVPGDHNETVTSNTENNDYIHTEDSLVGQHGALTSAFDLNDHISDSESLQFTCLKDAADQQSLSNMESKVEGYYVPPKGSSRHVSDTFLLPSAKVRPDILCIQDPKALFIHSEAEDHLSNSVMSPQSVFSEHYGTLPHSYSDDTTHNVSSSFITQHLLTSSGYITDYSTTEEVPFSMVH